MPVGILINKSNFIDHSRQSGCLGIISSAGCPVFIEFYSVIINKKRRQIRIGPLFLKSPDKLTFIHNLSEVICHKFINNCRILILIINSLRIGHSCFLSGDLRRSISCMFHTGHNRYTRNDDNQQYDDDFGCLLHSYRSNRE